MHQLLFSFGNTVIDPNAGLVSSNTGTAELDVAASMLRNGGEPYHEELQYLALLKELVDKSEGDIRADRTGTGTYSVFGRQMRFNLARGFPLLTTKNVWWKGVVAELLWMLSGSTNIKPLVDQGVHIWDEWASPEGELGPVYGAQWRSWSCVPAEPADIRPFLARINEHPEAFVLRLNTVDQIETLLENLRSKPNDRGHIVSAWNVAELDSMALRPCHTLFQFYVDEGKLSCQLYQRSADIFLGVPFNIASYALLTQIIARELDFEVGEFIHTFGDLHLYSNHVEQAKLQLTRTPYPFPTVEIPNHGNNRAKPGIYELTPENINLVGYQAHPAIKAEVSV